MVMPPNVAPADLSAAQEIATKALMEIVDSLQLRTKWQDVAFTNEAEGDEYRMVIESVDENDASKITVNFQRLKERWFALTAMVEFDPTYNTGFEKGKLPLLFQYASATGAFMGIVICSPELIDMPLQFQLHYAFVCPNAMGCACH